MISDKAFFRHARSKVFGGVMTESQVKGCQHILTAWRGKYPKGDTRWLAYMLATAKWETAHTMQPIAEYGRGKGRKYGEVDPGSGQVFYGRGYVQLTWRRNYGRAGSALGVDFINNPDLVMRPDYAARIMMEGMAEGWFTGKKLADYINPKACDWKGARRIINGTDKAAEIAGLARGFHECILAASDPETVPDLPKPEKPPATSSTTIWAQIAQWITGGGAAALAAFTDWRVALAVGVVGCLGLGLWIIRERLAKREEFGQ